MDIINITTSVIIPSYNSSGTIAHTLNGLLNQMEIDDYEIIVVDSSDDGEFENVIKKFKSQDKIRFIRSEKKLSPSEGRNLGITHSAGSLLVFLDSDVIPSPCLLNKIKTSYEAGHMAGGGGIEIPDFQKETTIALAQYYLQFNEYLPVGEKRVKQFIPSCNFYCDRDLLKQVGGFPDLRASEDVVLGLSLGKITEIWFMPEATVFHIFRENWDRFLDNQKLLGKYVAIYRQNTSNSITQRGILPVTLSPVFYAIKFVRIAPRIFKAGGFHIRQFFKSLPIFLIGLLFWTLGFIQGSMGEEV